MTMNFLRVGARIPVELPVEIVWKTRTGRPQHAQGKTATMSGNGLYMEVPVRLRPATPISITVTLPVEITRIPLQLFCGGRVVRQSKPSTIAGIGAIIDDYRIRPAHREV